MTDFDADETVQPVKRRAESGYSFTDKALAGSGVILAALAAFFPWYVFLHPEQFSVPPLWQGDKRDLPDTPPREVMSVSPLAMVDDDNEPAARDLDLLSTATVPALGSELSRGAPLDGALNQPMPLATGFRLMHVANGRALIEDASGMYIVRVGSILPDNSRLATLEQRGGKWVIVTSNGDVYERN